MRNTRPYIKRVFGMIETETPFNAGWVDAIKQVIPPSYRKFQGGANWQFDVKYYACVLAITKHFFGETIIDSTGGVSEQQTTGWKEAWEVYKDTLNKADREYFKEQHRGRKERERPQRPTRGDPCAALFVTSNAPKEVITAAYRTLIAAAHPDRGGDPETAARINAAYNELKKQGRV
jgi:hypothetical protein